VVSRHEQPSDWVALSEAVRRAWLRVDAPKPRLSKTLGMPPGPTQEAERQNSITAIFFGALGYK